jgi:hypothetical protein
MYDQSVTAKVITMIMNAMNDQDNGRFYKSDADLGMAVAEDEDAESTAPRTPPPVVGAASVAASVASPMTGVGGDDDDDEWG